MLRETACDCTKDLLESNDATVVGPPPTFSALKPIARLSEQRWVVGGWKVYHGIVGDARYTAAAGGVIFYYLFLHKICHVLLNIIVTPLFSYNMIGIAINTVFFLKSTIYAISISTHI